MYDDFVKEIDDLRCENSSLKYELEQLKKQLHEASLTIQEMMEQDIECPNNCDKLRKLLKQLEERRYYKFYKYENNPNGSDYCFCERPCDSNMSLKYFFENGEICGFMSETLVSNYDIEEVSLNVFAHDFIKPLINTNFKNKKQQKEFIEWLENEINKCQNNIFYEGMKRGFEVSLQKYKEIVGVPDENKRN